MKPEEAKNEPPRHEEKKRQSHKLRKRLLIIFARSLDTIGWLSLFYFWYDYPFPFGMIMGVLLIFAGIVMEVVVYE